MRYILALAAIFVSQILPAQNLPTKMFGAEIGKAADVSGWKFESSGSSGDIYSTNRPHPILGDGATLALTVSPKSKVVTTIFIMGEFPSKGDAEVAYNAMKMAVERQFKISEATGVMPSFRRGDSASYRSANNRNLGMGLEIISEGYPRTHRVQLILVDIERVKTAEQEAAEKRLGEATGNVF